MNFDVHTRSRILIDMTLDFNPRSTTVELNIDGTWYPATWQGTPAQTTGPNRSLTWTQTAQTTGYFAGPSAVASGAVVLTTGSHAQKTRVTNGSEIIAETAGTFTVA